LLSPLTVGRWSADAGVLLRKDSDAPLGCTHDLAAGLADPRDPRRRNWTRHDLRQPRVVQMAAGDEEAHDAPTRRDDPLVKLRRERLPAPGAPIAAQPTISRCAHRVAPTARSRMALVVGHPCRASSSTPPPGLVLEVDDPEAPVHGGQAQARWDGSEGGAGFFPCHVYEGLAGRLLPPILKAKRCTGAPR
jgi:hypothetical protein